MEKYVMRLVLILLGMTFIKFVFSQVTDIEGHRYKTVLIGKQEWMAENLNVSIFRNGDTIPQAHSIEDWTKAGIAGQPVWCYYNDDPTNKKKYGKLYNWYAVIDERGLAPISWHIPIDIEWQQLFDYLGGNLIAGTKMKNKNGWKPAHIKLEDEVKGRNSSKFSALPAGHCDQYGNFSTMGYDGFWWSSSSSPLTGSVIYFRISSGVNYIIDSGTNKGMGLSIRCVRDQNNIP